MSFEFLPCADGAEHFVEQLVRGLDLANYLVDPRSRNVAVGTGRTNPRPVLVVDGILVLLIDEVPHFVTRGTESFGVGRLKDGVKTAPGDYARREHQYAA